MRPPISIVVSLLLLGGCQPDEREAAVRLEVTYSARPGCITVLARDARAPHGESNSQVDGDRLDGTSLRVAIFRQKSWSHTLEIITAAHEQSCDGPVVAKDERQVQLNSAGVQSASVRLEVTDEDGDGYMPVSVGGTDCDDGGRDTHPGAAEVCDDRDNDCNGSPDDGLSIPWYADQDGDGFGDKEASPVLSCRAPAGPTAYVSDKTDCDDLRQDTHPGAVEACDSQDNDCDESVDEEGVVAWYPDRDGDNFGDMLAPAIMSCAAPAGPPAYVQDATDCLDSNPNVHPRPEGPETTCDDVDDDCDGAIDDGFPDKGAECSDPCPNGRFVCNPRGDGLICEAPRKIPLYPDKDFDGAGNETAQPQGEICPNEIPPSGESFTRDDCDDLDPYNYRGRAEVCDSRDNNCNGTSDEGSVCAGKGWNLVNDAALTGNNHDWRTVALGPNGLPVWLAGMNGVLAVRVRSGGPFASRDGNCGTHNWYAAWVRPGDGHVFLAGDGGQLAEHDGSSCSNATQVASHNDLRGLVGFVTNGTTVLYVVDRLGRLYVWTPGNLPQERYNTDPPTYFGIHGTQSNRLLIVGDSTGNVNVPFIVGYPGTGGMEAVRPHTLTGIPVDYTGALRAVWMAESGLAYSVGDRGLVMKWDGAESWERVLPPTTAPAVNFTSVVVLDMSSIYVTSTDGSIRRLTARGWVAQPLYDTNRELWDIALNSPGEIWEDGRVVHFPQ
jgi:hypothetical protein